MSINFLRRPDKNEFGKRLEDEEAVKQKTANYFLRNKDVFALDEIWVRSDPKSREIVGKKLLDNEITDADKRRLLGAVQGPITLYGERNVLEGNMDRGYVGIRGNETEESILEAVMKLPDKYRIVIHLFYYEEQSITEISETLKRREGTVKSQLSRGRALLKEMLTEEWNND